MDELHEWDPASVLSPISLEELEAPGGGTRASNTLQPSGVPCPTPRCTPIDSASSNSRASEPEGQDTTGGKQR
jgi:hypothetical protein